MDVKLMMIGEHINIIIYNLKSLDWLKITHTIQNSFTNFQVTRKYNKPSFFCDLLCYNQVRLPTAVVTFQSPSHLSRLKMSDIYLYFQAFIGKLYNISSLSFQTHSFLSLSSSRFHKQFHSHHHHHHLFLKCSLLPRSASVRRFSRY